MGSINLINIEGKPMKILGMLLLTTILLSGCNTVSGIGQDMRKAGDALDSSSNKVKRQF